MKTFVKVLLSVLLIASIVLSISLAVSAQDESVVERINSTLDPLDAQNAPNMALASTKAIIYNAMYDAYHNLKEDMDGYEETKARLMEKELILLQTAIAEYYADDATYLIKYNSVSWIKNVIDYGFTDLVILDEEPEGELPEEEIPEVEPVNELTEEPGEEPSDESTDEPDDIKAQVAAVLLDFEAIYKAKRDEVESYVPVSEYEEVNPGTSIDFEGDTSISASNLATNVAHVVKNGKGSNGSNSYYEIIYHENSNTFIQPNFASVADNYVIEFDYTTFGAVTESITLTCADECLTHGAVCRYSRQWPVLVGFEGYNVTNGTKGKGQVLASIVPGQWTHISIVIDNVQDTFDLYVNYELVEQDRSYAVATHELDNLKSIRIGTSNTNSRSFAVDSIIGYQGTYPRTLDRISSMTTDEERNEFYANTLTNMNASFTDRYISLNTVVNAIPKYYVDGAILPEYIDNAQVQNIVNAYLAYAEQTNPEAFATILEGYKVENLDKLLVILNRYVKAGRKLDNITARTSTISLAESFLEENIFDETSQGFKDAKATITTYKDEIAKDNAANAFVKAMFSFDRAPTVDAKKKHYNVATASYDEIKNATYNGIALIEYYKQDVSKYPATATGNTFSFYFDMYDGAKDELDSVVRKDNSESFIICISYISDYDTDEEYLANFAEIKRLIEIARDMVYLDENGSYFDRTIEGFADAMQHYDRINGYFYDMLQLEHVRILSEKLAAVENSDSYIERSGACTYVNNYLAANDVDTSRADIQAVIAKCKAFEEELDTQLNQYEELLAQNTAYFVNTIAKISAANDYASFRALYDEATEYYYKMNINDAVGEAVELYEQYRDEITEMENESVLFMAAVKSLSNAKKRANQYKYLVECSKHIDKVEAGIDGVSAAIATYNQCKSNYDNVVNTYNSEILETVNTMCTVRENYGAAQAAVATKEIFE